MQKAVIFLSCLVCLVAASSLGLERKLWWLENVRQGQESSKIGAAEQSVHEKQKFLLDVLLQLHKPLVNRELLELGKELITDSAAYQEPIDDILLEFLEKSHQHEILGRNEIYTDLNLEQSTELVGLTKFLTLAKDWPTFQRNVCFARRHVNPVLFINALQMAVNDREDTQALIMPAMNEILPHLFYDKDVILTAENVDWNDLITKTTTTKPSLLNVLGLGNMLGLIGSPAHWIRIGKTGLWRPRQEHRMSLIAARSGGIRGHLGRQINIQSPLSDIENEQPGQSNLLVQSEEKIVIPVEQPTPLSYLTDDVALNMFWNSAIKERVVQTLTGNKHQGFKTRTGVHQSQQSQILSPFSRHQSRWQEIQDEDETTKQYETAAQRQKLFNERLTSGRYGQTNEDDEWTGANEDIMMGQTLQTPQTAGQHGRPHPNERLVHVNRRHQNAQRKQQQQGGRWNEEPESLGNIYATYDDEDEEPQQTMIRNRDRLSIIRSGRMVHGMDEEEDSLQDTQGLTGHGRKLWNERKTNVGGGTFLSNKNKIGESRWGQKSGRINTETLYNVPKWSRIIEEDDDEEINQQGGWTSGIWNRAHEKTQTRNKIGKQQKSGHHVQQNRHMTEGEHWMSRRNVDEETMPQRSLMNKKMVNMHQFDEETMHQRGIDAKNLMNLEQDEDETMKQHNIYNKMFKSQHLKPERDLFDTKHQEDSDETMHSRIPRSIKTIDISPEQELMNARSSELFLQNIQQLVARINLEKISLSQSINIDSKTLNAAIKESAPQLLTTSGSQYKEKVLSPAQTHRQIQQLVQQLQSVIDNTLQKAQISQGNPDILEIIGDILVAQNTEQDNILNELFNEIDTAIYGVTETDGIVTPLSNPTVNLREPIYHDILTSLSDLIESYRQQVEPYKRHQLLAPGIHINNIDVDELVTYFDVTDADLINLVDQQLLQTNVNNLEKLEKQLVARQQRLNHKQFTLSYDISAQRPQRVVVRTFLGPKINENGQIISLEEARQDHILLDAFVKNLETGFNHIERNSREITWAARDTSSFTEIYRRVMHGQSLEQLVGQDCRFPQRLILPRGTPSGLPMQLFVVVTPVTEEDRLLQQLVQPEGLCGLAIAAMHLDKLPLTFPLDRPIENVMEFLQPNMILKDITILHEENAQLAHL